MATAFDLISALDETVALLNRHGATHWAKWFERDRELVAKGDFFGVEHLLTAFGGMGSFNDLYLCKSNGHAISENEESEVNANLSRLSARLYDVLRREREKH